MTSSKEKMDDVSERTDATNEWMKLHPDQQLIVLFFGLFVFCFPSDTCFFFYLCRVIKTKKLHPLI